MRDVKGGRETAGEQGKGREELSPASLQRSFSPVDSPFLLHRSSAILEGACSRGRKPAGMGRGKERTQWRQIWGSAFCICEQTSASLSHLNVACW